MTQTQEQAQTKFANRPFWQQALIVLLLLGALLVLERQFQNYLGKRAIAFANLPEQSLAGALEKSELDGKPVLANFSALWCSSCRKLEREVLADKKVRQRILADYHYARVEYEDPEQAKWFRRFKVSSFPTLIRIDGIRMQRLARSFDPEVLHEQLLARDRN